MSSYELLGLIEYLPEEGEYRKAARGGEYSEEQLTMRHLANEVARLRATMHAVHGGQRYEPVILMSVAQRENENEDLEATADRREDFFSFADRTSDMSEAI